MATKARGKPVEPVSKNRRTSLDVLRFSAIADKRQGVLEPSTLAVAGHDRPRWNSTGYGADCYQSRLPRAFGSVSLSPLL